MGSKEKPSKRLPSGGKYVEALQNTNLCFREHDLKGARPDLDSLGRPRPISGNFASVCSLSAVSGRCAVKCFTRDVADQEARYRAISDSLEQLSNPWKISFEYLSQGILVEGEWYPLLKMEWVDASSLSRWIEQNLHDPAALAGLPDRFAGLVNDLAEAGIAHGDLQHGNLLVTPSGSLRLVDYDGMYVPSLAGSPAGERGHRNYQPPTRSTTDFGPTIDRFSAWVIYLSLVAVASDQTLWHQLRKHDAEHLLLAENDFTDPMGSARFAALLNHIDPDVSQLAQRVQKLMTVPLNAIPQLTRIAISPPEISTNAPSSDSRPAPTGRPSWMAPQAGNTPQLAPPQDVTFADGNAALRTLGVAALLLLPAVLILAGLGVLSLVIAVLASTTGIVAWLTRSAQLYRSTPELKQAKTIRSQHGELKNKIAESSRHIKKLDERTRKLDQAAAAENATQADKQRQLQDTYDRELVTIQQSAQQRLARIDIWLQSQRGDHQRELDNALQRLQEDHIRSHLTKFHVSTAEISGIGSSLIDNLCTCGITTAADFTEVTYSEQGKHQSRIALFQLSSGGTVRVPGIGEVKARRLDRWRIKHRNQARQSQPMSLPDSHRRAIEDQFLAREHKIAVERQQVADEVAKQRADIARRSDAARATLFDQIQQASTAAARVRTDHERQRAEAATQLNAEQQQMTAAIAQIHAYRQISYMRYLRFILAGR